MLGVSCLTSSPGFRGAAVVTCTGYGVPPRSGRGGQQDEQGQDCCILVSLGYHADRNQGTRTCIDNI